MENLTPEQQEILRKASNERLRVMAARLGSVDEEEIESMDRPVLLVVRGMTARAEGERAASVTARSPPRETTQSRELEVQLELRRVELEI